VPISASCRFPRTCSLRPINCPRLHPVVVQWVVTSSRRKAQKREKEAQLPDFVSIEKGLGPEGRIAIVRFDRGDGVNALSPKQYASLQLQPSVSRMMAIRQSLY
jgi:hypothetical protein